MVPSDIFDPRPDPLLDKQPAIRLNLYGPGFFGGPQRYGGKLRHSPSPFYGWEDEARSSAREAHPSSFGRAGGSRSSGQRNRDNDARSQAPTNDIFSRLFGSSREEIEREYHEVINRGVRDDLPKEIADLEKPTKVKALLIALIMGIFGVHNFYLGFVQRAFINLLLGVVGIVLTFVFMLPLGFVPALVLIWVEIIHIYMGSGPYEEVDWR